MERGVADRGEAYSIQRDGHAAVGFERGEFAA